MNTILVWVLITMSGYNSNHVNYSPSMTDLESCQRLQQAMTKLAADKGTWVYSQCVQIRMPK